MGIWGTIVKEKMILYVITLLVCCASPLYASTESSLVRYALIVGSNSGGDDRIPLRYANSDAISIAEVFEELGELMPGKKNLLLNPNQRDIDYAFNKIKEELAREKSTNVRQEMIFYYSGHSDDKGLLLYDGRFEYTRLKKHLAELDVDVRLAMLDSCEAESFMKSKGGKRIQPLAIDDSNKVSGYVYLAASSENEAAQESKSIGGSFFTHYFVSALRGAADNTDDKRVTLNEAYQYAYNETIARTKNTRAGAQHAAYDIQLKGAGDLVLTDLNRSSSSLAMDEDVGGRVFIHNDVGRLVVELTKVYGKRLEIGLVPGQYEVSIREGETNWKASAELAQDKTLLVSRRHFESEDIVETVSRGAQRDRYFQSAIPPKNGKKMRLSLGYLIRVLDFWIEPNVDPNTIYQGIHSSINFPLEYRSELALDAHFLVGRGELFGGTASVNFNVIDARVSSGVRLLWYIGLGGYIDSLTNFYSLENAPAESLDVVDTSSNMGFVYSTGMRFQIKEYGMDLLVKQKSGYSDSEKSTENAYPEFIFRIGYTF